MPQETQGQMHSHSVGNGRIGVTPAPRDSTGLDDFFRQLRDCRTSVPHEADVADYLAPFGELAQFVPVVCDETRRELGPDMELSLEIRRDPEFDDRQLTLYVRTLHYQPDMLERLHALGERFNRKLEECDGDFLLATDFAPPLHKRQEHSSSLINANPELLAPKNARRLSFSKFD